MIRSLDILSRSLNVLQKRQENTSGNIANVNTSGYQTKQLFQSALEEMQLHNYQSGPEANRRKDIGGLSLGTQLSNSTVSQESGAIKQTNRATDFAVMNDGYFAVRTPEGQTLYTKNGNFTLNEQNQYVTQEGYTVLDVANNPIAETAASPQFQIWNFDEVASFADGGTYYLNQEGGRLAVNPIVQQGYLTQSNVSVSDEMVSLMQTSREYEANQKILNTTNDTLKKAVNELGKI